MTAQPNAYISVEDYLFAERERSEKHEYYAGRIYAMSGASARHNRIAGSAYAALYAQLRHRDCNIYPSDMRVKVLETGLYTYPDITIVCGHEQFDDKKDDTLLNPTVIIEVLSPSTEKYDRGRKFLNYRTILSLREYILISQDGYHVERYMRQSNNTWVFSEATGKEGVLELTTVQCTLALEAVYEKIQFLPTDDETAPDMGA